MKVSTVLLIALIALVGVTMVASAKVCVTLNSFHDFVLRLRFLVAISVLTGPYFMRLLRRDPRLRMRSSLTLVREVIATSRPNSAVFGLQLGVVRSLTCALCMWIG